MITAEMIYVRKNIECLRINVKLINSNKINSHLILKHILAPRTLTFNYRSIVQEKDRTAHRFVTSL